jgi:hypothetical protein
MSPGSDQVVSKIKKSLLQTSDTFRAVLTRRGPSFQCIGHPEKQADSNALNGPSNILCFPSDRIHLS